MRIQAMECAFCTPKTREKVDGLFDQALAAHRKKNGDNFEHFVFPGYTDFNGADFTGDVNFGYAQFIADADFGLANFIGEAKFHESKFIGRATALVTPYSREEALLH